MAPPARLETPRLVLIRLTDTTEGSRHVQLFHEDWTDAEATAWSLHGPTKTLQESQEWMIEHLTKYDNWFYAVFSKPEDRESTDENPGVHIGSVSLRAQAGGPTLPPPEPPSVEDKGKPVDLRVIGYALFKAHWGKGYVTEANKAMLDGYAASLAEEKLKGEKAFYIEAGVDEGNPGSQHVLKKLGFAQVGWKPEAEPVFLAGEWRHGGYWIYGRYI